ncbi:beta-N-acetylhexosaminidase [Spirosoma soli]|uniref:beta-N-acetylhexosaminidase n=1 Tax=Spirosoma soli TaxID=1770529 RepID=A0ABW5LZ51_9BACT
MKKLLLLVLFLPIVIAKAQTSTVHIIPQPVDVKQRPGTFLLTKATVVAYAQPESRTVAEMLATKLSTPTGYTFTAKPSKLTTPGTIQLSLNSLPNAQLGNEGYTVDVSPKVIKIAANKPAGLFYGMQTLLQLFPKEMASTSLAKSSWTAPCVRITDYPRFGWRGVMLDVSRHFFSKEDVMRYIDEIAQLKYNTFHWHLTDDQGWRIEIKSLPRLTQVGAWRVPRIGKIGQLAPPKAGEAPTDGGFYTQEDIKEVVRYAQERNVTIVPEIDVPGHSMAAIAAYPELSCTKDTNTRVNAGSNFSEWYGNGKFKMFIDNTLNPSDEHVYAFLDKVFTEVAALFPNPYIHAGGDECYKGYWENDPGCKALMQKMNMKHSEELQSYFMKRVEQILKAKGKKLIGWDEILEGGIAPEATVMSWRGIKGGIEAAKLGHEVVMTPNQYAYIDYMQSDPTVEPPIYSTLRLKTCYNYEPVPDSVDAKLILGGQANLWTEAVSTLSHAEYMTYPRCWALADVYWSPKESKNWEGFIPRMETQFERADLAGINYARSAYDPIVTTTLKGNKLVASMDTEIPGLDVFYTIDDSVPGRYANKYGTPIEIPEGPITLRVITYRAGKPIGRMLTLKRDDLRKRAK